MAFGKNGQPTREQLVEMFGISWWIGSVTCRTCGADSSNPSLHWKWHNPEVEK